MIWLRFTACGVFAGCFSVLYSKLNAKVAVLLTAKLLGTL